MVQEEHQKIVISANQFNLGTGKRKLERLHHRLSKFEGLKGQLISKCPYENSVLSKIPTKKFPRFLS